MSAEDVGMVQAITGLDRDGALALLLSANSNVELAIARHFDGPGVPANAVAVVPPQQVGGAQIQQEPDFLESEEDQMLVDPHIQIKDEKTGQLVPMTGVKVAARVIGAVGEVTMSLRFENRSTTNPIEATFQLADEGIIVHGFEVCIGDSIIEGKCMEKQEAFAKYDDAISSGHTAFLAEKKSKRQTFDISAGNMQPGTVCVINVRYMMKLEMVGDKMVFGLPVARAMMPLGDKDKQGEDVDEKNEKLKAAVPEGMNVTVAISQPQQRILAIACESGHDCDIEKYDVTGRVSMSMGSTEASSTTNKNASHSRPSRFEISISVSEPNQASCVVEQVADEKADGADGKAKKAAEENPDTSSSSMVVVGSDQPLQPHEVPFDFGPQPGMQNFGEGGQQHQHSSIAPYGSHLIPSSDNSSSSAQQTEMRKYAMALSVVPKILSAPALMDVDVKAEVIFMLDCSGSMAGGRMRRAKSALALFLRALPESARFNILAFGDAYIKLFDGEPRGYNQETLRMATEWLDGRVDAKMGGTNLLAPFQDILSSPIHPDFPSRQIFLLTDGDVKNKDDVLKAIRDGIGQSTRIFSFGIGNEVSQALMRGIAKFGRGKCEFVESTTPLEAPVMRQVSRALQPCLDRFEIDWGKQLVPIQSARTTVSKSASESDYAPSYWGESSQQKSSVQSFPLHTFPPVFDGERFDHFCFFEAPVGTVQTRYEIKIKAYAQETAFEFPAIVDLNSVDMEMSVQRFAAAAAIEEMEKSANSKGYKREILDLALKYKLASKYTSFVAVHLSNEAQAATGHMVHMDVDEAAAAEGARRGLHSSDASPAANFLASAGEKLEEMASGFGRMMRTSGNYIQRKLEAVDSFGASPLGGAVAAGDGYYDDDATESSDEENDGDSDGLMDRMVYGRRNSASNTMESLNLQQEHRQQPELRSMDMPQTAAPGRFGATAAAPRKPAPALKSKDKDISDSKSRKKEAKQMAGDEKEKSAKGGGIGSGITGFFKSLTTSASTAPAPAPAPITVTTESSVRGRKSEMSHSKKRSSKRDEAAAPMDMMMDTMDVDNLLDVRMEQEEAREALPVAEPMMMAMNSRSGGGGFAGPFAPPPPAAAAPAGAPAPPPPSSLSSLSSLQSVGPLPKKASTAMELVLFAQANGSFVFNAAFASLIGSTLALLLEKIPAELSHNNSTDVWATALAIAVLEKWFSGTRDEWSLVHSKARKFIAKSITTAQLKTTVDAMIEKAKEIV